MNQEFRDAALYGELDTLKSLLEKDPQLVHEKDEYEFTALHEAVGEHCLETIQLLIAAGADVNAKNDHNITPLHLAAYDYIAEALIDAGANIESKSKTGATPLHTLVAEPDSYEVIEVLLKRGANKNATDSTGITPMQIAESREDDEILGLLEMFE